MIIGSGGLVTAVDELDERRCDDAGERAHAQALTRRREEQRREAAPAGP